MKMLQITIERGVTFDSLFSFIKDKRVDVCDFSPNIGNRELLKNIASFQKWMRPFFYLTPTDYFVHGTLA